MSTLRIGMKIASPIILDGGQRVALAADDSGAKWHLLFPLGIERYRADFPNGKIKFSADILRAMAENYQAEDKPERPVNYNHQGPSSVPGVPEQKIAAGWIKDVAFSEDGSLGAGPGLYAQIEWTARARTFILADEFRYLSPEFTLGAKSKRTGKTQGPTIFGAALLNDPFLTELPRVAASENPTANAEQEHGMKCPKCEHDFEHDSDKALADLKSELDVKLSEGVSTLAERDAMIVKLNETISAKDAEIVKLNTEKRTAEVKAFVDDLVKAGKVTPAIREDVEKMGLASGVEAIKFFERATPAVRPGVELGVSGAALPEDKKTEATKKFEARRDELQAKGLKFTEAHNQAKAELPNEFAIYFTA